MAPTPRTAGPLRRANSHAVATSRRQSRAFEQSRIVKTAARRHWLNGEKVVDSELCLDAEAQVAISSSCVPSMPLRQGSLRAGPCNPVSFVTEIKVLLRQGTTELGRQGLPLQGSA